MTDVIYDPRQSSTSTDHRILYEIGGWKETGYYADDRVPRLVIPHSVLMVYGDRRKEAT